MAATTTTTLTLFHQFMQSLMRVLPGPQDDARPSAWPREDSSWHTSTFELMQGLDVIEHHGAPPTFADTVPACFDAGRTKRA